MSNPFSARALLAGLVLVGAASLALRAADTAKPADATAAAAAAATPAKAGGRYFEMRTYHAAPGKLDALHARFRDHTIALFKKHGIESVAYWTAIGENAGTKDTLVFILAYPSADDRDRLWNAFAKDPEWTKAKTESEKDGPLVEKVEQVFMAPTDYSPLK